MINEQDITKISIAKLTDPRAHDVVQIYTDFWWVVTKDDCVLFYNGHSPQCNKQERIAKKLLEMYPDCSLRKIGVAFVDWEE